MSEDMEALYEASFTLIGIAGDSKAESMQPLIAASREILKVPASIWLPPMRPW